jgi:hypothetical protein
MALSILAAPSGNCVFTPEYFTVQESSGGIYADTNFKFIAVLKDGSGTELGRFRFPIYPGQTNKGVVCVHRILEAEVSNFFNLTTSVTSSTAPVAAYEVEFGKEYGTPVAEYLNEINSERVVVNAACENTTDVSGEFLIGVTQRTIHENEYSFLYFNNTTVVNLGTNEIQFKSYSASGTLLSTKLVSLTHAAYSQFKFGVGVINTAATGSPPTIHADATYYTVQYLLDSVAVNTLIRYDIVDRCSPYDGYTLCWLNDRGGFDSWYFNMKRKDEYQIERRGVKTNTYEFNGNIFERNDNKHSRKNFYTSVIHKVTLNTDNLSTADSTFLKGLFTSPGVYLLDGSDYYPVIVQPDTYEIKKNINEGVFSAKVDIEYSEPENVQRL